MRPGALPLCLFVAGCTSAPPYVAPADAPAAIILLQNDSSAFVCHTARVESVDGKPLGLAPRGSTSLPVEAGHRTLRVLAESGFDYMGCIYACVAHLTFTARPDGVYELFHAKDAEPNRVTLTDTTSNDVVAEDICRTIFNPAVWRGPTE